jgi:hypothetical protein
MTSMLGPSLVWHYDTTRMPQRLYTPRPARNHRDLLARQKEPSVIIVSGKLQSQRFLRSALRHTPS